MSMHNNSIDLLFRDPFTAHIKEAEMEAILRGFPTIQNCSHKHFLSLFAFLGKTPQKFGKTMIADEAYRHMCDMFINEMSIFREISLKYGKNIETAYVTLREINELEIHDLMCPAGMDESIATMKLVDQSFLPAFQRLTDGVYGNFILVFAAYLRIKRGASLEGFDLYNRVEEINNGQFGFLSAFYRHTVRNSIAHGDVIYNNSDIIFTDRRNSECMSFTDFISAVDDLLDVCNGLSQGLTRFYFEHLELMEQHELRIPLSIMFSELMSEINTHGWQIVGFLESKTPAGGAQLNIYATNSFIDSVKVQFYVYRSAVLVEALAPGFERYFISFPSKYGRFGWAAFNGAMLNLARRGGELSAVVNSLEERTVFFSPRITLPRICFRIGTLFTAIRIHAPYQSKKIRYQLTNLAINVRDLKIHRNGLFCVVRGSVVIEDHAFGSLEEAVRSSVKRLSTAAIRRARRNARYFSLWKYLPVGFMRISVYSKDFRIRKLRNFGLAPELICTIELKRLKRIKCPDICNGTPSLLGKYRVVWNTLGNPQMPLT